MDEGSDVPSARICRFIHDLFNSPMTCLHDMYTHVNDPCGIRCGISSLSVLKYYRY